MKHIPLKERMELCLTNYFQGQYWFQAPRQYDYQTIDVVEAFKEALERIKELESEVGYLTDLIDR